jgi:hypothetical protein
MMKMLRLGFVVGKAAVLAVSPSTFYFVTRIKKTESGRQL